MHFFYLRKLVQRNGVCVLGCEEVVQHLDQEHVLLLCKGHAIQDDVLVQVDHPDNTLRCPPSWSLQPRVVHIGVLHCHTCYGGRASHSANLKHVILHFWCWVIAILSWMVARSGLVGGGAALACTVLMGEEPNKLCLAIALLASTSRLICSYSDMSSSFSSIRVGVLRIIIFYG